MPPELSARDKARQIAEEATEHLAAELDAGRSEVLRQYLAAMGRFHRYSWTNTLLIQSQRPTATRVAGYHTWRDLGRSVRRGEKGIVIYAPVVGRQKSQEAVPRSEEGAVTREPKGFRAAYVFDVSQTEGTPLPEPSRVAGDPGEYLNRLKDVVKGHGITLAHFDAREDASRADGYSMGGLIKIRGGLDSAEEFSVLAHELAHELLHHGPDRGEFSRTVRETQAEAVAFVVARGIGLETNRAAADYIQLYNGDRKTLTESLSAVQRTSSQILRELSPREPERKQGVGESFEPRLHDEESPSPATRDSVSTQPELYEGLSFDH